ncbi:hypothetical protein J1N35_024854 [Gossypium stocksii]|uniref:Aminotransferase-like plant mobile domain-containing protein n=1 Tax=Gossypium stocksii TaxID=47602 RepID=A0A9D3ZX46_9ROSI|nr:hypothetical protein J1N35_024854 [Gossypium stocksii]
MLATLYREMCRVMQPQKIKVDDCMLLLQSRAWYRLPFLHPRVDYPYTFPLITTWNHRSSYMGLPKVLQDIRLLLYQPSKVNFEWTSYSNSRIQAYILSEVLVNPNIWHVKFRHHEKPYLLSEEVRRRQLHLRRPQRPPRNPRSKAGAEAGPLSAPIQQETPPFALLPVSMARLILVHPDDFDVYTSDDVSVVVDVSVGDIYATNDISTIFYATSV